MTGPSASGSENGTPSSTTSAPRRAASTTSRRVSASDGSPAVKYTTSARSPRARRRLEALERLVVRHRHELEPAGVAVVGVLGPDPRVVEPGGDRVRRGDLAVVVLQQVAHAAVQHADPPRGHRGAVTAGRDPLAARLDADDPHAAVVDERVEEPNGVRAAAHAPDP